MHRAADGNLVEHPQKITLGEMREMGVRGVLVCCSDYKCSHWGRIIADRWPDHVRLSDLEPLFVCQACGTRPADLRPNFHWEKEQRPVPELTRSATSSLTRDFGCYVPPVFYRPC
jgi:hypothetical protein